MDTEKNVFYYVLVSFWIIFIWEMYLLYRQYIVCKETRTIPHEVNDIYDEGTFERARQYRLDKITFEFWCKCYDQLEMTAILVFQVLPKIWNSSRIILNSLGYDCAIEHEGKRTAIFILLASAGSLIMSLPLDVYYHLVLEEKHGFNKMELGYFAHHKINEFVVLFTMLLIESSTVLFLKRNTGDYYFLHAWLLSTVTVLGLSYLISIQPDLVTELPAGRLRTDLEQLAAKVEFPLKKIYIYNESSHSSHSNAFFQGFYGSEHIVLYDTLLRDYTTPPQPTIIEINYCSLPGGGAPTEFSNLEILSVFAHELGHWHHSHVIRFYITSEMIHLVGVLLFAFLHKKQPLYAAFGFPDSQPTIIGMALVLCVFIPYFEVLCSICNAVSRQFEMEADFFAITLVPSEALCSSLIKIHKHNLNFPVDDWLYASWYYSHPPLIETIRAIRNSK